jgi:hypothetical protein
MATTQRPRTPRRPASNGPDPASRGLILVLVALALGALLLFKGGVVGFDSDGEGVDIGTGSGDGDKTDETTTSTTAAPATTVAPASVKVVAANGAGISGLAKKATSYLETQGYTQTVATDATASATTTAIYFAEGYEANAKALALAMGLPDTAAQALPAGAALAGDQPEDAGMIIVLGPDAAAIVDAAGATTTTAAGSGSNATTTTAKE